jgi:hypothetical protein
MGARPALDVAIGASGDDADVGGGVDEGSSPAEGLGTLCW